MDNLSDIKSLTLEEIVKNVVKMQSASEDIEAGIKVLKDELGDRLRAFEVSGTKVGEYFIDRRKLVTFPDVPMSQAVELGATVVKIDSNKLRSLFDKGIKLKHKITEYVTIKFAK